MLAQLKQVLKRSLPPSSLVWLRALDYSFTSAEENRLLDVLCDPSKTSIDVGANLGVLTSRLARCSRHVYAYEPNPELAGNLRRAFRSDRVTVHEVALSDAPGSTVLRIPYFKGVEMHGLASIAQDFAEADRVKEFTVPVTRLDDAEVEDVGFVKIDVEQNEEKVLRGAMRLLERSRPNILLEVSPKRYAVSIHEFLADLLDLGYQGFFLFDGQLVRLRDYRMEIHNNSANHGVKRLYMTNVILSPRDLLQ